MIEVLRNPMGSPVASPDDVVQTLMNDGTIDAMRMKIITQLKANEELKKATLALVEQSKVLNSPGSEKQTKRELFDSLRQELEAEALEKASKVVWELILSKEGVGKEINETVEKVFCRLSGRDPPQFPSLDGENQQDKVNEENKLEKEEVKEQNELERGKVNEHNKFERKKRKEKNKLEEGEKKPKNKLNRVKESKNRVSSSKKRNFIEISAELEEDEVPPLTSKDSAPGSRTVTSGSGKGVEYYRRCLRTDGKNWQCRMEAVPDGKYCENHMYKRSRQKTPVKTTTPLVKKKKKTPTLPKERLENIASTRRELETISRVKRELSNELEITTRSKKKKLEMNTRVPTSNIDIKNDFNVAPAPASCPMAAIVSAEAVPTSDVDSNSDFPRIPISDMDSTSNIPPLPMSNMESDSNIPPVSGPVSDIPKVSMSNISSNSNIPISTPPQGRTDGNKNDSDCDAVGRLGFSPKAAFVSAEHSSPESASIGAKESSALAVTSNVGVNHDIPIYTPPQGRVVNTTDKIDCDAAARLVFSAKAFVASVMDSSPVAAVMGPVGSSIRGTDSNLLVSTPSQDTNANNNNNDNANNNNNYGYGTKQVSLSDTRYQGNENSNYYNNNNNNNNGYKGNRQGMIDTRFQGNENSNYYYNNNNNNNGYKGNRQGMSDTRFQGNGEKYYNNDRYANQQSLSDNGNNNYHYYNNNKNGYQAERQDMRDNNKNGYQAERQGMSDTRFLEKGKYFYDLNNENAYLNEFQFRGMGTENKYNSGNNENSYEVDNSRDGEDENQERQQEFGP